MKNLILLLIIQLLVTQAFATQSSGNFTTGQQNIVAGDDDEGSGGSDDNGDPEISYGEDKVASRYYENLLLEKQHDDFIRLINRMDHN